MTRAKRPAAGERPPPPKRARRVLIIEDDADTADTLREALELCDHDVRVAYDGPEGVAQARRYLPDAVLCDIGLPSMSGYDVAAALRAVPALKRACLIALTGYSMSEDRERAAKAGFDHHLAKPPDMDELEGLVASAPVR